MARSRWRKTSRLVLSGLLGLSCYREVPSTGTPFDRPDPGTYASVEALEREAVGPESVEIFRRVLSEGTLEGVPEVADRLALLSHRRGELVAGPDSEDFRARSREEAARFQELARVGRIGELRLAREVAEAIRAGCLGCHEIHRKLPE